MKLISKQYLTDIIHKYQQLVQDTSFFSDQLGVNINEWVDEIRCVELEMLKLGFSIYKYDTGKTEISHPVYKNGNRYLVSPPFPLPM